MSEDVKKIGKTDPSKLPEEAVVPPGKSGEVTPEQPTPRPGAKTVEEQLKDARKNKQQVFADTPPGL